MGTVPDAALLATIAKTAAWPMSQGTPIFTTFLANAMRYGGRPASVRTTRPSARFPGVAATDRDSNHAAPRTTGTTTTSAPTAFNATRPSGAMIPARYSGTPTADVSATHPRMQAQSISHATTRLPPMPTARP